MKEFSCIKKWLSLNPCHSTQHHISTTKKKSFSKNLNISKQIKTKIAYIFTQKFINSAKIKISIFFPPSQLYKYKTKSIFNFHLQNLTKNLHKLQFANRNQQKYLENLEN